MAPATLRNLYDLPSVCVIGLDSYVTTKQKCALLNAVVSYTAEMLRKVRQQDAYRQTQGAVITTCNIPAPLFKGNISIADSMPLSSLLKTIKINGGIECRLCMTNIWLITAWSSRVITTWTTVLAYALSALEALRNALYKFKTYLLTYLYHISEDGITSIHNINWLVLNIHCCVATVTIVHDPREPTTICLTGLHNEHWSVAVVVIIILP